MRLIRFDKDKLNDGFFDADQVSSLGYFKREGGFVYFIINMTSKEQYIIYLNGDNEINDIDLEWRERVREIDPNANLYSPS